MTNMYNSSGKNNMMKYSGWFQKCVPTPVDPPPCAPHRAEAKSIQELWLWVGKTEPQTLGSSQQDDQTAEKSQT